MKELQEKIAIVTGAAVGIGKGIALSLAEAGAKVVIADIKEKELNQTLTEIKGLDADGLAIICDVSKTEDIDNLVKKTLEKYTRIDILVNNAGIYPFKPFTDISFDDWKQLMGINLDGVYDLTRSVVSKMIEQEYGKIINIASIAGTTVGYEQLVHYSTSKAGLDGFTKALAMELAKHNINVNAISPGAIKTHGTSKLPDEQIKQIEMMIPLGRMGLPKDIANAVVFLASNRASFITGQNIIIDGGQTARP